MSNITFNGILKYIIELQLTRVGSTEAEMEGTDASSMTATNTYNPLSQPYGELSALWGLEPR